MASELKVSLSLPVRLLAGERVLYFKPIVWGASGKSLPSYRLSLSLPLIQEMGLYITDRRVLLPCWLLRLVRFEWTAWFTGEDQTADEDHLESVAVGCNAFFGPYLELITCNPVGHWWRSRQARIRLFMKNPEPVCRLISEALGPATPRGEQDGAANRSQPTHSKANPASLTAGPDR